MAAEVFYSGFCLLYSIFKDFMLRNTHHDIRHTIPPRCDNCFFSVWMMGASRPALTCKQKTNFVGRSRIVQLEQSCANFYPSGDFKAGSEAVRRIPLTQGKFALVDAEDYWRLVKFQWFAVFSANTFYASRKNKGKCVKMHREIMRAPAHLFVDHIDHDGLNNCKSNLRLCTPAQNTHNIRSMAGGTSKYKGVSRQSTSGKWVVTTRLNGKRYHIGSFIDEIEAAKAYDKKATELHGQFACLNFPPAEGS